SFHLRIVAELIAVLRTALTHLGAHATGARMERGPAEHKVRARLADLGAVEQQPNMRGRRVLAPHLQTIRDGRQADAVTVQTLLNALLHVATHLVSCRVSHDTVSSLYAHWLVSPRRYALRGTLLIRKPMKGSHNT